MKVFSIAGAGLTLATIFSTLALSVPVANASDRSVIAINPIAAAYIADQCEIPISPARTNWLEALRREHYGRISSFEAQGAETLDVNIDRIGWHKACQNFRNTLAHMGWL